MKRVLIITYYWPPQGGSGVQRWLKFAKYFRDFGWEPVVYTPLNPEMMAYDSSLLQDIPEGMELLKRKIIEPYSLYKLFTKKRGESLKPGFIREKNSTLKERLSLFIRSNLFIPDPKMLWIAPSARFLNRYLRTNKIDAIVSTGPPHSMHLIAKRVSNKNKIPWVADFRDPWTKMFTFKYLGYTNLVSNIHKKLERGVLKKASAIVTVSKTIALELSQLSGGREVEVITNGYDSADFDNIEFTPDNTFSITYTGLFVKSQNPEILWRVLEERVKSDPRFANDLKIKMVGNIDSSIIESIASNGLQNNLVIEGYSPHNLVVKWQKESRILLLAAGEEPESKGILTGKFFEYLAARRTILGFGPKDGDMDLILKESGCGVMFNYSDYDSLREWIEREYAAFKMGTPSECGGEIEKFSRRELTRSYSQLLNSLILNK